MNITKIKQVAAFCLLMVGSAAHAGLIEIFADDSDITSLADADALIATTAPIATDSIYTIDYNDGGDSNGDHYFNIGLDNPWPGGVDTDFVARITGSFEGPAGALADFRISHDDGVRMIINGIIAEFSGLTDDRDTFLNGLTLFAINTVEIVFFEHRGGASLEFAARCSSDQPELGCTATDYFLLGLDDPIKVPEPGSLGLLGLGLAGLGLARRRRKS